MDISAYLPLTHQPVDKNTEPTTQTLPAIPLFFLGNLQRTLLCFATTKQDPCPLYQNKDLEIKETPAS